METMIEKRAFKRFPLEFAAEVTAEDVHGKTFEDRTYLKDISGEGANFITHQPQRYYIGQRLKLMVHLPGTKEVKGCMKARATIVRISPEDHGGQAPENKTSVAIKLDSLLEFERLNLKP